MVTYIYKNTEVKCTGRSATKTKHNRTVDTLLEVTPVNTSVDGDWTQWARESDLYEVIDKNNEKT